MSELKAIAEIVIGQRTRREMGDLAALADSIREVGLLQPIGITRDSELVFGERRLRAAQLLGWTEIKVTVIDIALIAVGEYHENELRKDFTVSERVAILETIKRRVPGQHKSASYEDLHRMTPDQAVRRAGFGNITSAREAGNIVKHGIPALVDAVDREVIAIEPAFFIATQTPERQSEILKMPVAERRAVVRGINPRAKPQRRAKQEPPKRIDIPYGRVPWPTREEAEYPPEGSSLAEYDAYFKKYGRTPLHPKTVKEMLDADGLTSTLAMSIKGLTNERHPDADKFFEYIDQLLTHVRQPEKINGMQTDFAGKARQTLAMLEQNLPKAFALLQALDTKLNARKMRRVVVTQ